MPSQTPTSFASAAATNIANDNTVHPRATVGSGDWSRRPNGATQTFRRTSQLNTNSTAKDGASRDIPTPTTAGPYVPPHLNSSFQSTFARNAPSSDFRYSKEQLLEIFRAQEEDGLADSLLQSALTEGWIPGAASGNGRSDWNRKDDSRDQSLANFDVCWTFDNSVQPLSFTEMDEEEKELFTSSVNSPLKGPTQANKDGSATIGTNGRRLSSNQGQVGPSNLRGDRPGPRRRETSDSIGNGLGTPGFGRRDEANPMTPPSSLLRRRTDLKDGSTASPLDKSTRLEGGIDTGSPFNSWKRNVSGPMSAGITGPSSPWASTGPQSAGFGAFGNFAYDGTSGAPGTPVEKRLGMNSLRGESRFKGLMSKESSEDISGKAKDKSMLGLGKLAESYLDKHGESGLGTHQEEKTGSAALIDDENNSSTALPSEQKQLEDLGFSSFGTPSHLRGVQDTTGLPESDTMSAAGTNPYGSPESDGRHAGGLNEDDLGYMGSFSSRMQSRQPVGGHDGAGDSRSQTSSVGPQRTFPPLGGLGNLPGIGGNSPWSNATPSGFGQTRPNQSFGTGIFSSMADISSPGGAFGTPANSAFPTTRSKMGALFPEHTREGSNDVSDMFGSRGASQSSFPYSSADTAHTGQSRNVLDDLFMPPVSNEQQGSAHTGNSQTNQAQPGSSGHSPQYGRSPEPNQPPPAQQRQMVMPDRIRWIYRDPSGNTQGPFTGLEMHDWYKAGFFSPELQVKKVEEKEYEPLAQLIRRIGNSREPFLVPQIGIPHGPPNAASILGTPGGNANLGIQPPFGNSFPSFGTTLTADQQNALERRKQEEQILMARQKEHLQQQQQTMMRNILPGMSFPGQPLHHQASGQSLHSHPSLGNMAGGFINNATGQPGAFDRQTFDQGPESGFGRDPSLTTSLDRMNLGPPGQSNFGASGGQDYTHNQQVTNMMQDRARLQAQQDQWTALQDDDGRQQMDRLDQFHQLRSADHDPRSGPIGQSRAQDQSSEMLHNVETSEIEHDIRDEDYMGQHLDGPGSPPEPSTSPLPAPAAQRNRQHIAEALAAESSRPQTPAETSSLAPWAKEGQSSKVPSFQEIQEAEARKAAQQEEIAAAARRQIAEQERVSALQAAAMAQTQIVGLPSSANWATGSPSIPAASPWTKPAVGKVGTPTGASKAKTLAQIQKEEENRKQRAAAAAAAAASANMSATPVMTPGGKSYATLASKATAPVNAGPLAGGAWSVVGASGKAKAPAGPAIASPARALSTGVISSSTKAKPAAPVRSNTGAASSSQLANDAFQKWVKNSLGGGLNTSINVDDFVKNLMSYPLEEDIISDAIYGNSQTLDGNRFAKEFVARSKGATQGKVLDSTGGNFLMGGSDGKGSSGGWNEVAKKAPAPAREEPASNFKVVAAKKKGKR